MPSDAAVRAAVAAKSPEDLIAFLDSLGITTRTIEHEPLFRVQDSRAGRGDMPGGHTKNLFVKDKKGRIFLLVADEQASIDLKQVHHRIGAQGRVSFGSAESLLELWGVRPGSVTPFGAINDMENRVTVILEAGLMREAILNFHPLVNTRTTGLATADLVKFLRATGHEPMVVAFAEENPSAP